MTLTKTEKEDFEMLLRASETIIEMTNEMHKLECNGKYGTEEYEKAFENMKHWISLSDSIFNRMSDDYEKNKVFMEYIVEQAYTKVENEVCFTICLKSFLNQRDLVLYRLYNQFLMKAIKDQDKAIEDAARYVNPDYVSALTQDEDFRKMALYQYGAAGYIAADQISILLVLLEKYMNTTPTQKAFTTWQKYYYSALIPELEKIMISKKFTIDPNPFLITGMAKRVYGADDIQEKLFIRHFAVILFWQCIENIYSITDEDLKTLNGRLLFQYGLLEIRSRLALLDDEGLSELEQEFNQKLAEVEGKLNEKVKTELKQLFVYVKEDKTIPQKLSLGI